MSVTRNEMTHAASMVRAIAAGEWTNDAPDWADTSVYGRNLHMDLGDCCYTRAVQTAEAFILFFQAFNPQFDTNRFLIACGLKEGKP